MRTFIFDWALVGTTTIQAETQEEAETLFDESEASALYDARDEEGITECETLDFQIKEITPKGTVILIPCWVKNAS